MKLSALFDFTNRSQKLPGAIRKAPCYTGEKEFSLVWLCGTLDMGEALNNALPLLLKSSAGTHCPSGTQRQVEGVGRAWAQNSEHLKVEFTGQILRYRPETSDWNSLHLSVVLFFTTANLTGS